MMDYRYLKAFMATAKHQSFTLAAKELRIAQSAIGRQVKLLERELKTDLFIRSSKNVLLTDAGVKLYQKCLNFENELQGVFESQEIKNIRIGILEGILDHWIHPIINSYYERKGQHNLDFNVSNVTELKRLLNEGKLDLAFLTEEVQSDLFTSFQIFQEKYYLISGFKLDLKNLEQYRWIVYSEDDFLYQLSKKKSSKVISVNSMHTIVDLVKRKLGLAVVPVHIYEHYFDQQIQTYPVNKRGKSYLYLVMPNFKYFPPHLKQLVDLVKESFSLK